jgi:alpha(1,3/1,4) fucosyltransferase
LADLGSLEYKKVGRTERSGGLFTEKEVCLYGRIKSICKRTHRFFHRISKYKKVDSGGKVLNNIGGPVGNKMEFIKEYKFVISFENSSYPGYTTKILIEPMLPGGISIYRGNTAVNKDFNTRSFVHVNVYASYDEAIERIIELDKDEGKYACLANESWFNNDEVQIEMTQAGLEGFFDFVIKGIKHKPPVALSKWLPASHQVKLARPRLASI